ncbi:hypothetical protein M2474_001951 [Dysgonomonas sp. PH5-37]|uniref:hypothetical protein n=1 Tax=Dysgonomonas sp. PH5-37 TaxID=2940648 RepID=UPI002474C077|nr:hypothetical protein [Dysgonomonas sp. PH5-37]MDH6388509.1 hypothetical protein [Dysgonomonas sp. PH5-37]
MGNEEPELAMMYSLMPTAGFTSTSRIVTVEGSEFCRNVTVSGCTTIPTIKSDGSDTHILNICDKFCDSRFCVMFRSTSFPGLVGLFYRER